jgi:hypothetical protein
MSDERLSDIGEEILDDEARELMTEAAETMTHQLQERLEYELRGAYRAGYNFCYVGMARASAGDFFPRQVFLPTYTELDLPLSGVDVMRWERYDLRDLDAATYRHYIHTQG